MSDSEDLDHETLEWTRKTTWMREVHALEATFSPSGQLLAVKLEPLVESKAPEPVTEPATEKQLADRVKHLESERRRIAFAAAGGLVPRLKSEVAK